MSGMKTAIHDYLNFSKKSLTFFAAEFGRSDLIKAWREGVIPQSGMLANGAHYELHGIGCFLIFDETEIDFDLAPNGQSVGIDPWKLSLFVQQFPEKYHEIKEQANFEVSFEELVATGQLNRKYFPESWLYFVD